MIVDSFNYALYLSVGPSGTRFKFSTIDLVSLESVLGRPTNLDNSRAYYACKWWGKRGAVDEW